MPSTKTDSYRWIVTVHGIRSPYAREITTDGPNPDLAAIKGLQAVADGENDLWQADTLHVKVERFR